MGQLSLKESQNVERSFATLPDLCNHDLIEFSSDFILSLGNVRRLVESNSII